MEAIKKLIEKQKQKRYKRLLDKELFDSCMVLKNLAIVQSETPLSADFIFEKLFENSKKLKPFFGELILKYRQGDEVGAFQVFTKKIGTRNGRTFGSILSKLDKINPKEVVIQVTAFQEAIEDERITKEIREADRNAVITIAFSAATIFVILLNFTVVVVFMDTIYLLENLF